MVSKKKVSKGVSQNIKNTSRKKYNKINWKGILILLGIVLLGLVIYKLMI